MQVIWRDETKGPYWLYWVFQRISAQKMADSAKSLSLNDLELIKDSSKVAECFENQRSIVSVLTVWEQSVYCAYSFSFKVKTWPLSPKYLISAKSNKRFDDCITLKSFLSYSLAIYYKYIVLFHIQKEVIVLIFLSYVSPKPN